MIDYQALNVQAQNFGQNPTIEPMSINTIIFINTLDVMLTVALIVVIILFFRWIYITNSNAQKFGEMRMKYRPSWAVGWFFIPVIGLVMPYYIIREIWLATGCDKFKKRSLILVFFWWLSFFLTVVLSFCGNFVPFITKNYEIIKISLIIVSVACLLDIINSVLTLIVFGRITELQVLKIKNNGITLENKDSELKRSTLLRFLSVIPFLYGVFNLLTALSFYIFMFNKNIISDLWFPTLFLLFAILQFVMWHGLKKQKKNYNYVSIIIFFLTLIWFPFFLDPVTSVVVILYFITIILVVVKWNRFKN